MSTLPCQTLISRVPTGQTFTVFKVKVSSTRERK